MQFSLAHLTLLQCSPPDLVEIAGEVGFEFVSFRMIPFGYAEEPLHPLTTDRTLFQRTRSALRASSVRLLDVEVARIYPKVDVRHYLPALECAAELQGRHVLTSIWCHDMPFATDRFTELCELARPFDLTVDLEFVSYGGVHCLPQAAALVEASGCDNAGICIDTLHFDRSQCTLEELGRIPAAWFHYAQICDAPGAYGVDEEDQKRIARSGRLFLGEGGIDVHGIVSQMPPVPYAIELPHEGRVAKLGAKEFARRCLSTAKTHLSPAAASALPDLTLESG